MEAAAQQDGRSNMGSEEIQWNNFQLYVHLFPQV